MPGSPGRRCASLTTAVTIAAVTGGGAGLQPGEAALAHGGVLCLDDAPEFERAVLRTLAQPLRDGEIVIARGGSIARFPARFILVAGMRPCPCGAGSGCACTPLQTRRYRDRVTGTLGAWIPLRAAVDRPASPTSPAGSPARTPTPCPRRGWPKPATAWATGCPGRRGGATATFRAMSWPAPIPQPTTARPSSTTPSTSG